MKSSLTAKLAKAWALASAEEQAAIIAGMGARELLMLDAEFEMWAQEGQLPPGGEGWRVWLMMGGRGFGKTRAGAEWVHRLAMAGGKRIALVGASIDEARAVMVEGVSGLLSVARRQRVRVKWEPSQSKLTWPKGSVARLYSGDHGDGLRGPEHHFAWCDELAKWRQAESAWDNLQMGLRAGSRPRVLVTTTPRPLKLLQRIAGEPWTVTTGGRTSDNINLPASFVEVMSATYGGTRTGRQELDGELAEDFEGALWTRGLIEGCRIILPGTGRWQPEADGGVAIHRTRPLHHAASLSGPPPRSGEDLFRRVVVGVDPPAGTDGDACGIVVCGLGEDGKYYVLEDASVQGLSPEGWARAVAVAAGRWRADRVVAEANNGGAMVASCLRAADVGLPVKLVHASRGKVARAEPVALRFEAGRAFFVGAFPELEDELAGLTVGGGYEGPGRSPDRADAMVWAMTELGESRAGVPRVVAL